MLYLDNAATTLKKPTRVWGSMIYNTIRYSVNAGHGGHYYSLKGAKGIYETSEKLADFLGVDNPERIAFTQNATYALNLGIRGYVKKDDHVVTTAMEHNSVLRTLGEWCKFTIVDAERDGTVRPEQIKRVITPKTKLVVVNHASNVCGTLQDIEKIGEIAKEKGVAFMVDGAQSVGVIPIDVKRMGIDMLALSGHKGLMSPLGVGALYVAEGIELEPVITGGTGSDSKNLLQPRQMPDIMHSGTLNAPAIIACGKGIDYINKRGIKEIEEWEVYLAMRFIEKLKNMDNVIIYGKTSKEGRNSTVLFNVGKRDSTEISGILNDEFGICLRGGYHCAYLAHKAIGSEKTGGVRASFGAFNTIYAVDSLVDAVYKLSKNRV